MTNKEIMAAGLAITLSTGAMAGNLTLISQNEPNTITVKCGPTIASEVDINLPIPPNGQRGPLPYILIRAGFHHYHLSCDFYENNTHIDIATASLLISNDFSTATITRAKNLDPSQFHIAVSTPVNVPSAIITAVVEKI